MAAPGPITEILGQVAYELSLLQPYLATYIHMVLSALFPIYTGAHASLSRPKSASAPPKNKTEDDEPNDETEHQMEGLSPMDAILYPILAGCLLGSLYFLIKWLQDPTLLNKLINLYLSIFGVFSVTKLLTDSMDNAISFVLPIWYSDYGVLWKVNRKQRRVYPQPTGTAESQLQGCRISPFPGVLSRLSLSERTLSHWWALRDFLAQPFCIMNAGIGSDSITVPLKPQGLLGLFLGLSAEIYYNRYDKPWWLTNLLGFSFSYGALQMISPMTCWTGTLVLNSLFFYDIYFVFFTPLMITVATQLDIPVKLLFPRPSQAGDDLSKRPLSMLGLGDVVIPGMMIGFALRFDLYLFYRRKMSSSKLKSMDHVKVEGSKGDTSRYDISTKDDTPKPLYHSATSGWGERFWVGSSNDNYIDGGKFPKTYFHATLIGYVCGMLCTLAAVHIYKHGQPALLYLVPFVLGSLWGTAFVKGDIKILWNYTEADEEAESKNKDTKSGTDKENTNDTEEAPKNLTRDKPNGFTSSKDASNNEAGPKTYQIGKKGYLFCSIKFPRLSKRNPSTKPDDKHKPFSSLADELQRVKESSVEETDSTNSSISSTNENTHPRSSDDDDVEDEPAGKRQRRT